MEKLRLIVESDFWSILGINDSEVRQTSHMDLTRLQSLVRMADYCKLVAVDGQVAAFLIALVDGKPYENANYQWFASRFPHFLYVDRIVVDSRFSRRGIGSRMYGDLFEFAYARAIGVITCEYNVDPPNPASRAFHAGFGFKELGTQWVADGTKKVSLQAVELQDKTPADHSTAA